MFLRRGARLYWTLVHGRGRSRIDGVGLSALVAVATQMV
jgi:hypothetical protein